MTPALTVAVPSHERPLRLRWLLNALEEQTLPREDWEIVVCHDSGAETETLLREHPLAAAGVLRHVTFPRPGTVGEKRNAAWRAGRGAHVLFTDDDCRPPAGWLARAAEAAREHPGAVVQGRTRPDPDEAPKLRAAGWRSQEVEPPDPWAHACNILYPRAVLEQVGGFHETWYGGEDTDLLERARAEGAAYVGALAMETYHAVEVLALPARIRLAWRWRWLPAMAAEHPDLRRHFPGRIFWKRRHAWFVLMLFALAGRRPGLAAALGAGWAREAAPSYGSGPRGRARALSELPGAAVVELAEIAALARGSVAARTLLL